MGRGVFNIGSYGRFQQKAYNAEDAESAEDQSEHKQVTVPEINSARQT